MRPSWSRDLKIGFSRDCLPTIPGCGGSRVYFPETTALRPISRHNTTACSTRVTSTWHPGSDKAVALRRATAAPCADSESIYLTKRSRNASAREREQLATMRRYRALVDKRAQLMREFLQIYEKVMENSAALNYGRFFA